MTYEARKAIDAYLDLVDAALLKSDIGRARRTGIVRDLELHALEELRTRTGEREPTLDDVNAILAGLGTPDSFATSETPKPLPFESARPRRTLPTQLRWGALLIVVSFFGILILAGAFDHHLRNPSDFLTLMIAATPVTLMLLLGSALGYTALRKNRSQPTRHWGRIFALLELAAFPLMVVFASPLLFFTLAVTATLLYVANRMLNLRHVTERFLAGI
jgi:hypothetical protein